MRTELKALLALGVSLGLAGTAFGAANQYHAQSDDPCAVCHSLASAKGWVNETLPAGTNWTSRKGPQKCYLCHLQGNTYGATDQILNAYGDGEPAGVHMYSLARQPNQLDGATMAPPTNYFIRNIAADGDENNIDCISCHDVHSRTNRPYLANATTIQQLCKDCHGREWSGTKAAGNVGAGARAPATPRSTHPQAVAYVATTVNGITNNLETFPVAFDYAPQGGGATVRKNFGETHPDNATWGTNWNLGGHVVGGGAPVDGTSVIDCQTCHAVHGGENYPPMMGTTGPLAPETSLLVAPIVGRAPAGTADNKAPVCQACHRGGDASELVQNGSACGTSGRDHPIGVRSLLYSIPTTYIDTHVTTDAGDQDSSNREGTNGWGRYWGSDGTNNDIPLCVTCHDVHGGLPNTALYRKADNVFGGASGSQTAANWCYTCHGNGAPIAHHSHKYNLSTSQIYCEDCHGLPGTYGYQAHGEFFTQFQPRAEPAAAYAAPLPGGGTYTVSATDQVCNVNSALCVTCHSPANPTDFLSFDPIPLAGVLTSPLETNAEGTFPARHGVLTRGSASHQVLRTDNNSTGQLGALYAAGGQAGAGIMPVTNFVDSEFNDRFGVAGAGAYAKYGNVTGGGKTAPAAPGSTALILCESCHNVQYNYGQWWNQQGSPTDPQKLASGYETNLLLRLYEDDYVSGGATLEAANSAGATADHDNAATDSEFCNRCHPFSAVSLPHVHGEADGYLDWGQGLEVQTPTFGSWADATIASVNLQVYPLSGSFPGNLTWRSGEGTWIKFDCDACHRPHNAANTSTVPGSLTNRTLSPNDPAPLITERAGAIDATAGSRTLGNPQYKTEMCENCHATRPL